MSHHPSGSQQGHGTLGPLRREAVGGPTTGPKCEAANNAAPREHHKREVFRQTECEKPGLFLTIMDEFDIGQRSSDQMGGGKSLCPR